MNFPTPTITQGILGRFRPPEGFRCVGPFLLEAQVGVTGADLFDTSELQRLASQGAFSFARSIYIDNAVSNIPFSIQMNNGYLIQIAPVKQGWFPILSQRPIIATVWPGVPAFTAGQFAQVKLFFANFNPGTRIWNSVV